MEKTSVSGSVTGELVCPRTAGPRTMAVAMIGIKCFTSRYKLAVAFGKANWIVGMLECWNVGVMDCWILDYWILD